MEDECKPLLYGGDTSATSKQNSRVPRRRLVIEPVLLFGSFLSIPIDFLLQMYLVKYYETHGRNPSNATNTTSGNATFDKCGHASVADTSPQSLAAQFSMYLSLVNLVPLALTTWLFVSSSDKFGRKPVIILPLIGNVLRSAAYAVVIGTESSVYWITIGQVAYGISGGLITLLSGCMAYVVDTTSPEERLFRITVVELVSFMTLSVSCIGLGYLIKFVGYMVPCIISTVGTSLLVIYTIVFVPETVTLSREYNSSIFSLESLSKPLTVFYQQETRRVKWSLVLLLLAILPAAFAILGMPIQVLYLMHYPICWDSVSIGYFQAVNLAVVAIGTIVLVKLLKKHLPDTAIALLAGVSCVCATTYNAFCYTETMIYFVPVLAVMAGGYIPSIRAIMTKHVSRDLQGALFGGIGVVETLAISLGQMTLNAIYAATQAWWAGFSYLVVSFCYVMAIVILGIYTLSTKRRT